MEECAFDFCRHALNNILVALRQEYIDSLNTTRYKTGDKVCAVHFKPHPAKQVISVRRYGHLINDAYLAEINYIKKQRPHDRKKPRKRRYIRLCVI